MRSHLRAGCGTTDRQPGWRRPWTTLAALSAVLSVVFVVSPAEGAPRSAAADEDPRCDDDVVQMDQKSETTLTPVGTRIVLTRAQCSDAGESDQADEIRVTANPTGVNEYVVAVLRNISYQESGGSNDIRRIELHVPAPPNSVVCVEVNGEKHCLPPQ